MADTDSALPRPVRGRLRLAAYTRVAHGLHRPTTVDDETLSTLAAWQLLMPGHGCFTGLTSALVRGWWLPPLPDGLPVFMAMARDDPRPMRDGVRTSRHPTPVPYDDLDGLRCASVPETLLACARVLGTLDLVVLVDCVLHLGAATREEIEAVATANRRGGPALRRALARSDGRSESFWETLLRMAHGAFGVAVEPQHELVAADGTAVARADLLVVGTTSIHEYDGADHRESARQTSDLRRDRRILRAGHVRRGYTADDVVNRPIGILRDADEAIGRDHDPSRVRPWLAMLRESLVTPAGTAAFLRRISGRRAA